MKNILSYCIALLLLALPLSAWAAITLDGTNTEASDETGLVATLTFARTTANGVNTGLLVQVAAYGTNRVTSGVTYHGTTMTKLRQDDANNVNVSIWYLPNPDVGAFNIVVTQPGNVSGVSGAAVSLFGVQQSTTSDATFGTAVNASGGVTDTITTVAQNTWIFDSIGDQSAALSATAPQTRDLNQFGNTGGGSYKTNIAAGSNSMAWTWTGSETGQHSGAALAPAPNTPRGALVIQSSGGLTIQSSGGLTIK